MFDVVGVVAPSVVVIVAVLVAVAVASSAAHVAFDAVLVGVVGPVCFVLVVA